MAQSTYVTDWLDKRSRLTPDRVGLVDYRTGEETSYRDWNARVNSTAHYLHSLGLVKGNRLAVYSGNNPEYVDLFFAAGKLGIILQNLNWRLTAHELESIISDGGPRALMYSPEWAECVDSLRPSFTTIEEIVVIGEARGDDRSITEREEHPGDPVERPEMSMDDPWGIYYTGGTTGIPKGAILTHGNITWNSVNTISSWGLHGGHIAPLQLPFFHVGGPNIFLMPLVHTGGKTVLCEGFDLDETFDLIESGGLTHYVAVPTMYQMMQAHPRWEDADFSRLELVISGGAPCPLPVMEKFWERGIDFKMGYGLTEAAGNNFWLPPEDVARKTTAVGHPLFHIGMPPPRRSSMDGSIPAISLVGMTRASTRSSAAARTCTSVGARTCTRPRSRASCAPIPVSPRQQSSAFRMRHGAR